MYQKKPQEIVDLSISASFIEVLNYRTNLGRRGRLLSSWTGWSGGSGRWRYRRRWLRLGCRRSRARWRCRCWFCCEQINRNIISSIVLLDFKYTELKFFMSKNAEKNTSCVMAIFDHFFWKLNLIRITAAIVTFPKW